MVKQCPCCGSWLPDSPILVGGRERQKILDYIIKHPGCTKDAIVWAVYGADPNGGPDWARSSVTAIISKLRKQLEPLGLTIPNGKAGPGEATYRIIPHKNGEPLSTTGTTNVAA